MSKKLCETRVCYWRCPDAKVKQERNLAPRLRRRVDIFANLVVKATVEHVQKVVVGALLAVGVHDAVKVGEVPIQIHVVGILAPQEKIFAALEIGIKQGYFTVTVIRFSEYMYIHQLYESQIQTAHSSQ